MRQCKRISIKNATLSVDQEYKNTLINWQITNVWQNDAPVPNKQELSQTGQED